MSDSHNRVFALKSSGGYWEIVHVESNQVYKKIPKIGDDNGYRAASKTVNRLNKQFA